MTTVNEIVERETINEARLHNAEGMADLDRATNAAMVAREKREARAKVLRETGAWTDLQTAMSNAGLLNRVHVAGVAEAPNAITYAQAEARLRVREDGRVVFVVHGPAADPNDTTPVEIEHAIFDGVKAMVDPNGTEAQWRARVPHHVPSPAQIQQEKLSAAREKWERLPRQSQSLYRAAARVDGDKREMLVTIAEALADNRSISVSNHVLSLLK